LEWNPPAPIPSRPGPPDNKAKKSSWSTPFTDPPKLPHELSDTDDEEDIPTLAGVDKAASVATRKVEVQLLEVWQTRQIRKSHRIDQSTALNRGGSLLNSGELITKEGEEQDLEYLKPTCRKTEGPLRFIMLSPSTNTRTGWDLGSMVLVLYDMIVLPLSFMFEDEYESTFLTIMEWCTRLFWTADMPMSLISGFVTSDGTIEMRPWYCLKKYLKVWFMLDVLVVGTDWMETIATMIAAGADDDGSGGNLGVLKIGKMGKFFRILRMLRLLRLAKVSEIINMFMERLPSEKLIIVADILKLVLVMLSMSHFVGCIWYAIGNSQPTDANLNWVISFGFAEEGLDYKYLMSFRWALSQFAGGMDEVTPVSLVEHTYSAIIFVLCFWSGTVILSILTSHMTQLYLMGNQQTQQLNIMRRYLQQNGVSRSLTLRVQRNAQHTMRLRAKEMPEKSVGLEDLVSKPLRIELHFEMYSPKLLNHPWFELFGKECPHIVRMVCHGALSGHHISENDTVFHVGETASAMMICRKGSLTYQWGSGGSEIIDVGKWVSEAALWAVWNHRGLLTAREDSAMYYVDTREFQVIVNNYEIVFQDPGDYAREFVRSLNDTEEDVTDLPLADTGWRKLIDKDKDKMADEQNHQWAQMAGVTPPTNRQSGLRK